MGDLRRLVRKFGEWVEMEPMHIFDRISGKHKAQEREHQIQRLVEDATDLERQRQDAERLRLVEERQDIKRRTWDV